jgi:hypothetical protein
LIDEDTVKQLMTEYFKLKDIKATAQKGSGPDFLEAGTAIEIKGSKSDFDRAMRQFIEYLLSGKYKGLSVAFPHDFLDAGRLAKFMALGEIAERAMNQYVRTYILTDDKNFYYVKSFNYGREVWIAILENIIKQHYAERVDQYSELTKKAKEDFKDFDQTLQENLSQSIREKSDQMFSKSALPQIKISRT